MLVIRFFRVGKKNQPSFKIIVTDKRKPPRGGRFVEEVGFYNPLTKEKILKQERIKYWLSKGVKPSNTVYNLLIEEKILEGKKISVHPVRNLARACAPEGPSGRAISNGVHKKKKSPDKPSEKTPEKTPEKPTLDKQA